MLQIPGSLSGGCVVGFIPVNSHFPMTQPPRNFGRFAFIGNFFSSHCELAIDICNLPLASFSVASWSLAVSVSFLVAVVSARDVVSLLWRAALVVWAVAASGPLYWWLWHRQLGSGLL
jgi:hypothetical protein